eukprot:9709597-Heterocapsa_arctica.AAC.1
MDSDFARDLIGGMDFMGTTVQTTTRQRRQRDKDMLKANQEERTVRMDHIMDMTQMGDVCHKFTTVEDFKCNQAS